MTFLLQRSFVLETAATPGEAYARLRQLLDAPQPACGYCGWKLTAGIRRYCVECGHAFPGNVRLEGVVSPERFCVTLRPLTGIFARRPAPPEICGRFEAAPGGARITVSINPPAWEYAFLIPVLFIVLVFLINGVGAMAIPLFILVLLVVHGTRLAYFRPDADQAQEILSHLWPPRVSA